MLMSDVRCQMPNANVDIDIDIDVDVDVDVDYRGRGRCIDDRVGVDNNLGRPFTRG